jgi:DNA primase
MARFTALRGAAPVALLALTLTACGGASDADLQQAREAGAQEQAQRDAVNRQSEAQASPADDAAKAATKKKEKPSAIQDYLNSLDEPAAEPSRIWRCSYSPTYNRDWHDDVVCSNGTEEHRPYLREWDSFISQDEIMESAREYEQHLNGG